MGKAITTRFDSGSIARPSARPSWQEHGSWSAHDMVLESLADSVAGLRERPHYYPDISTEYDIALDERSGAIVLSISDGHAEMTQADIATIRWIMARHLTARGLVDRPLILDLQGIHIGGDEIAAIHGKPSLIPS